MEPLISRSQASKTIAHPELPAIYTDKVIEIAGDRLASMELTMQNLTAGHPLLVLVAKKYEGESALTQFGALMTAVHLTAQIWGNDQSAEGSNNTEKLEWELKHAVDLTKGLSESNFNFDNLLDYRNFNKANANDYLTYLQLYRLLLPDPKEYAEFGRKFAGLLIRKELFVQALDVVSKIRGETGDPTNFSVTKDNYQEAMEKMAFILSNPEFKIFESNTYHEFACWIGRQLGAQGHLTQAVDLGDRLEHHGVRRNGLVAFTPEFIQEGIKQRNFKALWGLACDSASGHPPRMLTEAVARTGDPEANMALIREMDFHYTAFYIREMINLFPGDPSPFFDLLLPYIASQDQRYVTPVLEVIVEKWIALGRYDEIDKPLRMIPFPEMRDQLLEKGILKIIQENNLSHFPTAWQMLLDISSPSLETRMKQVLEAVDPKSRLR